MGRSLHSVVLCGIAAMANISVALPLPRIIKPIGQPTERAEAGKATKIYRPLGWLIKEDRV
jgi:hypothetical protein